MSRDLRIDKICDALNPLEKIKAVVLQIREQRTASGALPGQLTIGAVTSSRWTPGGARLEVQHERTQTHRTRRVKKLKWATNQSVSSMTPSPRIVPRGVV